MTISTLHSHQPHYPARLLQMHRPPKVLYYQGTDLRKLMACKRVAIVGSRRMSSYGRQQTQALATSLAEQGVVIVSGLAIGVDAQAHQAALDAGGLALAVLPTPIDNILPAVNRPLARRILEAGGTLISSYAPGSEIHKGNFVERNEILAALSDVVVITEAAHKSGSLHTANFAANLGVDVMALPGNVTSPLSAGTNQLLKTASVVTSVDDVFFALGLTRQVAKARLRGDNNQEQGILNLLQDGIQNGDELLEKCGLPIHIFNQTLTMLEITGKVVPLGNNSWGLA